MLSSPATTSKPAVAATRCYVLFMHRSVTAVVYCDSTLTLYLLVSIHKPLPLPTVYRKLSSLYG
ncbi:hypothetical protein HETIRDRAFT_418741 [Heterobasidion irregulare TC 32-1]|uniref:Uncharacterized protein n=1 Tax=Heterobasidion irregulare (strain TC 32-1) TaxID=747525 RepID=W4K6Y0_HETIT|nr:uncharacterized protein HETIRDRAFT_418741 [Heterobasidion irregulare TC 32-1]ETW80791.1 hypothetical protein HETIRDRAFT_418741 [Heterobasidion irregulare TC 32-1]